jgi:hypothetical protein
VNNIIDSSMGALMVTVKLSSDSVTLFMYVYFLTCLYCIIMEIPHLLVSVVVVVLPLKKLLSDFTTKSGCSSGIK